MNPLLVIPTNGQGCAEIVYDTNQEIDALIVGSNLLVKFPFTVRGIERWQNRIMIDRLSGRVFQQRVPIGTISQDVPRHTLTMATLPFPIEVTVAASALLTGESVRSGSEPWLDFQLQIGLIEQSVSRVNGQTPRPEAPIFHTAPFQIQQKIPRDRWLKLLEKAAFGSFFLVEIRLPNEFESELAAIARNAYKHFLEGGSLAYQSCVAEIRKGLEILQRTHDLSVSKSNYKSLANRDLTKQERIENLFHGLHHYTHLSHHENDLYSQTEAQLALAMFVSLGRILASRAAPASEIEDRGSSNV